MPTQGKPVKSKQKRCSFNICGLHREYTHKTKITRQKSKSRQVKKPRIKQANQGIAASRRANGEGQERWEFRGLP